MHPAPLAVLAALALLVLPVAAQFIQNLNGGCLTNLDCVLNGECVNGVCQCDEGWTGKNCEMADLIPADTLNSFGSQQYPTWGGKSSPAPLFFAQIGERHSGVTSIFAVD